MAEVVIQAENISKAYQIGQIGTGTISRDIERFFVTKVLGKEDPFLKIGETNDRSKKGSSDIVWSLRDINFEINQGDAVGIIGKNGAGKSTLLKLLSRVTAPTTGTLRAKGRIASLLEVGTGFHPELTGRENIFLNGAILGMRKKEIARKLDEIIAFSGVERYVDTPVKRYSSGMYVRLAFAVAAHLESEILIVDEVLAVGDAEFQKKCLGKMGDISKCEGRTILFVSHNMSAVKNLCTSGILLENGLITYNGSIDKTIENYLKSDVEFCTLKEIKDRTGNGKVTFNSVAVYGINQNESSFTGSKLNFQFEIENQYNLPSEKIRFDMRIEDSFGQKLTWVSSSLIAITNAENPSLIEVSINKNPFVQGTYFATLYLGVDNEDSDLIVNAFKFDIEDGNYFLNQKRMPKGQSSMYIDFDLKFK